MPIYVWEGRTREGGIARGEMEAPNEEQVIAKLRSQHVIATKVKKKPKEITLFSIGKKIKTKDVVIFSRQFATMIDAGLPLVQCLDILASQQDNPSFKRVLMEIRADVSAGSSLARALGKHPRVFNDLYVALVAAGETGGILDTILNRLSTYLEKSLALTRRVKSALIYPLVVVIIASILSAVLLIFVIPVFADMFSEFGAELPGPTKFVINMSNFVRHYFLLIILAVIGIVLLVRAVLRTDKGRTAWDTFSLRMPIFGELLRKNAVAKFTRTLGTMISSGVPILDSLEIVAKTSGNKVVERAVMKTRDRIAEGKTIAEPLAETGVFPPMVVQMITVGEATGALDVMLTKIADFYEDEVDVAVDALSTLLEPIMIVIIGGMVGGMLIAMYLPIFKLASIIK
ncbi:MAG TPA: type II secretion system F family protein [Proteobacteria bacterium]|nr:type II secretion system F family protein [Pseudomonadota bacterium]